MKVSDPHNGYRVVKLSALQKISLHTDTTSYANELIDQYQIVTVPVIIGAGRTMFEGVAEKLELERVDSRSFSNGNIVNTYRPKP